MSKLLPDPTKRELVRLDLQVLNQAGVARLVRDMRPHARGRLPLRPLFRTLPLEDQPSAYGATLLRFRSGRHTVEVALRLPDSTDAVENVIAVGKGGIVRPPSRYLLTTATRIWDELPVHPLQLSGRIVRLIERAVKQMNPEEVQALTRSLAKKSDLLKAV